MLMADTLAIALVVVGFLIAFQALWLLSSGLWPARVAAAAGACDKRLLRCLAVGVPVVLVAIVLTAIVGKTLGGPGQIAAFLLASLLALYSQVGVAGLVTVVGRRLRSPADAARPWAATLRGGVVLAVSFLLPILGWFVLLPASALIGVGAMTLTLRSRHGQPPADGGLPARSESDSITAMQSNVV
jgi:hypothetical protein